MVSRQSRLCRSVKANTMNNQLLRVAATLASIAAKGTLPPAIATSLVAASMTSSVLVALPLIVAALLCPAGGVARAAQPLGMSDADVSGLGVTPTGSLAIQPMTTIGADGVGYFADPYPVRLAPSNGGQTQVFSGTTKAIIWCAYPVSARCFAWTPATIDTGALGAEIAAAGASITNLQNLDVFQDDVGGWHAALTIGVHSAAHPNHWTVLVHAHATAPAAPGIAPLAWSADTVLQGSFSEPVAGNHDGKYFQEGGRLYLVYVKNFVPKPALRNGIVIQPMLSPTQPEPGGPTTLLMPGDRYGALNSEFYGNTQAKLVEAPYIAKIAGKYALIYSTGAYQQVDYKAGVAWSDTLMPAPGSRYRKVLEADVQGVWGQPSRPEVRYLLQSQLSNWPNFTAGQVISPGVASAVEAPSGAWRLYFAGFDLSDRPPAAPGSHRRPYFVGLRAAVPLGKTAAAASDAELATWLQPEVQ